MFTIRVERGYSFLKLKVVYLLKVVMRLLVIIVRKDVRYVLAKYVVSVSIAFNFWGIKLKVTIITNCCHLFGAVEMTLFSVEVQGLWSQSYAVRSSSTTRQMVSISRKPKKRVPLVRSTRVMYGTLHVYGQGARE